MQQTTLKTSVIPLVQDEVTRVIPPDTLHREGTRWGARRETVNA